MSTSTGAGSSGGAGGGGGGGGGAASTGAPIGPAVLQLQPMLAPCALQVSRTRDSVHHCAKDLPACSSGVTSLDSDDFSIYAA